MCLGKGCENMKRRKAAVLAAGVLILSGSLLFAGCKGRETQQEETEETEAVQEESGISIGLSFDTFVLDRWLRDRDAFVAAAESLGAETNVQNANGDVEEQIDQIRYLIRKQVDVLVVVATDCQALSEVMTEAKDAGIKTISYDRLIQNAGTDLYISFDNEKVGELMAETLVKEVPENGEIFMIQGSEEDNNVELVRKGFQKVLSGSSLKVVYTANCQGWRAELSVDALNEGLEKFPDVAGIMCGNDGIANQVITTLAETRRAGSIPVVGQDGDLTACQRIVEGTQSMTVFKQMEKEAETAAEFAVKLARGEDIDTRGAVMNDGSYDVPALLLEPVAVNRDNLDEIVIDSGLYSREDVYLNVQKDLMG